MNIEFHQEAASGLDDAVDYDEAKGNGSGIDILPQRVLQQSTG